MDRSDSFSSKLLVGRNTTSGLGNWDYRNDNSYKPSKNAFVVKLNPDSEGDRLIHIQAYLYDRMSEHNGSETDRSMATSAIDGQRIVNPDVERTDGPTIQCNDGQKIIHGTAATVTIELNEEAKLVGSEPLISLGRNEASLLALREALALLTEHVEY